jgi:galactose oxidase
MRCPPCASRAARRSRRVASILATCLGIAAVLFACHDLVDPQPGSESSTVSAPSAQLGEWGPQFSTQIVALHASLVPLSANGAGLLVWGHVGAPYLWDFSNSTPTFVPLSEPAELFCAGYSFLPDGSLLVVGGHDEIKGDGHGIPNVYRFVNGTWVTERSMSFGRWYPTATTLENGDVIVYAGTDNNGVNVAIPERYHFATHTWTQLTGASKKFPYYPRSFLDPTSGKVFYAGEAKASRWLDPDALGGAGKWSSTNALRQVADRNYGSAVMYEQGKILYAGGGGKNKLAGIPPTSSAELIDLNQQPAHWVPTGSMLYARRQFNLTILPDGKVLATGGTSSPGFTNRALPTKQAELWDPATGAWTLMAAEAVVRVYHGVSLLLPDGRIFSGGSGDGNGLPRQTTGQIFSPPYLFNADGSSATRPEITAVSATSVHYGATIAVSTPNPSSISKVTMIRFGAVTHAFNESQTLYRANFAAGSGTLSVTVPPNGRIAPPGPYLLFIVNDKGVPSVGKIIMLSPA